MNNQTVIGTTRATRHHQYHKVCVMLGAYLDDMTADCSGRSDKIPRILNGGVNGVTDKLNKVGMTAVSEKSSVKNSDKTEHLENEVCIKSVNESLGIRTKKGENSDRRSLDHSSHQDKECSIV